MARKVAPRQAPVYSNKVHGGNEMGGMPGDYTLNRDVAKVYSTSPAYKDGPCFFRPFPMLSYDDPQNMLQPGRESAEPGAYTHWMVQIRAAEFLGIKGDEPCTFLLYAPGDEEGKASNPYTYFYSACNKAHDSSRFGNGKKWNSEWNRLIKSTSKTDFQAIVKPSKITFMQGALYRNGDKDYMTGEYATGKPFGLNAKDPLVVLRCKTSASMSMRDLFDQQKESYEGDAETNLSLPFVFGDPVGRFLPGKRVVTGGKILQFFNPKLLKLKGPNSSWDGTIKDFQGYECAVLDEFDGHTPRLAPEDVAQVFDKVQFWFGDGAEKGLLRFPSPEEQVVFIARAFKSVPRLVQWVFEERPELMTDDVKGVLAARTSSVPTDDDGEDDEDETPKKKKKVVVEEEDDSDEEAPPTTVKKNKVDPTVKKKVVVEEEEDEEDAEAEAEAEEEAGEVDDSDEEEEDPAPVVKKKKPVVVEEEEEEEEDPAPKPKKKAAVVEEEEEEEEAPVVVKKKKPVVVEEEEEEEEAPVVVKKKKPVVVEEEEEEEEAPAPKPKKKPVVVEEEEEEEAPAPKPKKKPVVVEEEEEEEAPAPKPKKKAAVVEEEEEEEAPAPVVKKKKPAVVEEEEDEAPAPAKKKKPVVEEEEEDYFAQGSPAKSIAAAKNAGERSEKRSVAAKPAPAKPAPAKPKKK